jgi:hypothetical protein
MKINAAQAVIAEMLEADLQQAWSLLEAGQFDLAIHHFKAAITKTEQMRDAATPDPKAPRQLTIDIET